MIRALYRRFHPIANDPEKLAWFTLVNWVVCGGLYWWLEESGPISGLWWGIVTGSTVGYGDFYPDSTAGRGVAAWFIVSSVVLTILWGAHVNRAFINDPDAWTHWEQRKLLRRIVVIMRMLRALILEHRETARLVRENNEMLRELLARKEVNDDRSDLARDR